MPVRPSFKRRVLISLSFVSLLALTFFAVVWSMRPVWHTHISHLAWPKDVSLAVQYPDGWKFQAENDYGPGAILTPIAPSGLMGWWTKYVMHQDLAAWNNGNITVMVQEPATPAQTDTDIDKRYSHASTLLRNALGRAYKSVTSTSIDRNGIKGFDIEAHQALRPATNKHFMRFLLLYQMKFQNYTKSRQPIGFELRIYMTEEDYRSLKPTINEIIRRFRLVEDNRVSP